MSLSTCFSNDKYDVDNWTKLLSALKNQALWYDINLDLKSWFHHMAVHPASRRKMRFKIEAFPFGLYNRPYWAHRLPKVVLNWIRTNLPRVTIVWYMDDIVILRQAKLQVERATTALIYFLTKLGIEVNNNKKSVKQAAEQFNYLGKTINFTTGTISSPPSKLKKALNLAKKQLKTHTCVPRHLARLAGILLDIQKGVHKLLGVAKLLMTDTGKNVKQN